jgi:hypothetical protein
MTRRLSSDTMKRIADASYLTFVSNHGNSLAVPIPPFYYIFV